MSNYVLINGDIVKFLNFNGLIMVSPIFKKLEGNGLLTVEGKKICVDGDEKQVSISNCSYTTLTYYIPGTGTITIKSLADSHKSKVLFVDGKPALLKGERFIARFTVDNQATSNTGADVISEYEGWGEFETENTIWQSK